MDSQSQSVVGLTETIKDRICGLQQQVLVPRTSDAVSPETSKDKVSPKQPFVIGNYHLTFVYLVFVINYSSKERKSSLFVIIYQI